MNRTNSFLAKSLIPRICIVLLLLYLVCHVDAFLNLSAAAKDRDPDDMQGLTSLVDNPRDRRVEAMASFIRSRYKTSSSVAFNAAVASVQAAKETGLPATLFLAVAGVESRFRPNADNGIDKGIMQVNPVFHPDKVARIGGADNLFKVGPGIKTGARILKEYSDQKKGNLVETLLRYNGATAMNDYPAKVLSEKRRLDAVWYRKALAS